jgi:ribonucleoside-triphosphate reductase
MATPAEGLSSRFTRIDEKVYGQIKGITDKEYYTNSFHIPVYHNIKCELRSLQT